MGIVKRSENIKRKESIIKLLNIEKLQNEYLNDNIVIWGTNEVAECIADILEERKIDFEYYIDLDNSKHNCSMYNDKKIHSPYKLIECNEFNKTIILATFNWENCIELLDNLEIRSQYNICIPFIDKSINYNLTYNNEYNVHSPIIDYNSNYEIKRGTDFIGRVMVDDENEKVYRAIYKEKINQVLNILEVINSNDLIKSKIIDTSIVETKNVIENHHCLSEKMLEHNYLKTKLISSEYSKEMFKEAGIFLLDLLEQLNKSGLMLNNATISDIGFYDGEFKLVDIGSIAVKTEGIDLNFIQCFINNFINPLLYINKVQKYKNEFLEINENIHINDFIGYLNEEDKKSYNDNLGKVFNAIKSKCDHDIIDSLKEWLIESNKSNINTNWTNYHKNKIKNSQKDVKQKDDAIIQAINGIDIKSALDIGGNSGYYSYILAENNITCLLTDVDSSAVDNAFSHIRRNGIKNVVPMVKDFVKLSQAADDKKRLKSDLVMILALEHHLVYAQQLSFQKIIETAYELCGRYLLIEFVKNEDGMIRNFNNPMFRWYNKENFEKELKNKFIISKEINTEEHRVVYLCEKIR